VHPGYGFLAENEDFAAACCDAGLIFIGPSPEAIAQMGSKTAARQAAIAAGVPVVPGTEEAIGDQTADADVVKAAARIGYPLMLKAVAGGGGKGMRTVASAAELPSALRAARSEAQSSFGDGAVYLERRILSPRHIEVQLLADHHGTVVPFVERECSIQRRHQKIVEESPSLAVSPDLRRRMTSAAAAVARAVGYTNAGTIEFLLDADGSFYFLEMNTRLQVEHPITEMVTGVDLVQWQIRIARGERLDLDPELMLTPRAHAIECRIYAEDPDNGFMPSPGRITGLRVPQGPGVRDDSGAYEGWEVPIFYDPMISKLVTWGETRDQAIRRMKRALGEYDVRGIRTTIPFFQWIVSDEDFLAGRFDTSFIDRKLGQPASRSLQPIDDRHEELAAIAAAVFLFTKPSAATATALPASRWRDTGRSEALR
jgi:acetyl-CoA carboxylase biotin carboxylase subunit